MLGQAKDVKLPVVLVPVSLDALENARHRGVAHGVDVDRGLGPGDDLPVSPDEVGSFFAVYRHLVSLIRFFSGAIPIDTALVDRIVECHFIFL
jgi:hypothetical protein